MTLFPGCMIDARRVVFGGKSTNIVTEKQYQGLGLLSNFFTFYTAKRTFSVSLVLQSRGAKQMQEAILQKPPLRKFK